MKELFKCFKNLVYKINTGLVSFLLILVYLLVITPYSFFYKAKKERWVIRKNKYTFEDLKTMW